MLFIPETLLVYKLETFKNCKEVKHMIMVIAVIYIFFYLMWCLINSSKLLSENPQAPPEKIHSLLLTHSPLKIHKVQGPLFANTRNFQDPYGEKWEETMMVFHVF